MVRLIAHILGLDDASGHWYLWWSGIGADLGLIGGAIALYRRHNCEVQRCWRIGKHATAAGHHLCRRHHPDGPLTAAQAHAAHAAAIDR